MPAIDTWICALCFIDSNWIQLMDNSNNFKIDNYLFLQWNSTINFKLNDLNLTNTANQVFVFITRES